MTDQEIKKRIAYLEGMEKILKEELRRMDRKLGIAYAVSVIAIGWILVMYVIEL